MKGVVYKILSPSGKIYIGSTMHFINRMASYKYMRCTSQIKLIHSFQKYGFENHIISIVEECEKENIRQRESYYGHLFECLGENGLNLTLPKSDEGFACHSLETRRKRSESHKGKKFGKETTIRRLATLSEMKRNGYVNPNKGRKLSPEIILKYKESFKNRKKPKPCTEEHRKNLSIAGMGRINYQKLVLNTQTGIYYDSAKEAAYVAQMNPYYFRKRMVGITKNNTSFIYV